MSPRTLQRTLKSAHAILVRGGRTLSTAESCTGGMIGAAITSMAGSSQYYRGGVIAYDNAVKQRVLGVSPGILSKHGAVSGPTVLAMARGARKLLATECAIAVSGVAGPGGGSSAKPVGLVWIAVSVLDKAEAFECRFTGNRDSVRRLAVEKAMRMLVKMLRL